MIHVTSISSNVKKGANAQLKSKVLIVGPNGSGKSSILHALSLACSGKVYDVAGASEVNKPTDIVRHLGHGDEALFSTAYFSDGSEATWRREGTTTTEPVSPMDFCMLASDLLTGTNEAKRAEIQKLTIPLVTEDAYATARRAYPDFTLAALDAFVAEDARLTLLRPVERLIAVVESATAQKRAETKREKDLQTTINAISGSAGLPVTDDAMATARERLSTLSAGAKPGAVSEAAQDQARNERATTLEAIGQVDTEIKAAQDSQAQWAAYRDGLPAPAVSAYPSELLAGFGVLADYVAKLGADTCFVCGSGVGYAHLEAQAAGLAAFVAAEQDKAKPSPDRANADRTIAELATTIGGLQAKRSGLLGVVARADSVLAAPVASVNPAEISEASALVAKYEARQRDHLRLTEAKTAQAAAEKRIKTLDAVIKVAAELRITLMQQASGSLAENISKFMPAGTAFAIEESDVHLLIGFRDREGVFRSAASGAEEAAILIAIAAFRASSSSRGQVVVAPERQWSPDHLAAVMKAVENAPCQVVIVSTVLPAGKIARSLWSVVETGSASGVRLETSAVVAPPAVAVNGVNGTAVNGVAFSPPPAPAIVTPPTPPAPVQSPHVPPLAVILAPGTATDWLHGFFEPATDDDYPEDESAFEIVKESEPFIEIVCGLIGRANDNGTYDYFKRVTA